MLLQLVLVQMCTFPPVSVSLFSTTYDFYIIPAPTSLHADPSGLGSGHGVYVPFRAELSTV